MHDYAFLCILHRLQASHPRSPGPEISWSDSCEMSWSFNSIGKPKAVLALAHKQLEAIHLSEPEQTIKGQVLAMLDASLPAMPESSAVRVEASGSQSPVYDFNAPKVDGNT